VSFSPARARHIERLDDALTALAALDERKAKLIELRYFGGLGPREIGQSLNISGATVAREQCSAEMAAPRDGSRRR
jgi:RNA polymerase sigma factor (sigma-70 family)